MLRQASILWAAALLLFGTVTFLEGIIPRDTFGDMVPEADMLHGIFEHIFKLLAGILIFSLIDKYLLPDLDIHDLLKGEGNWEVKGEDYIRAAGILVWGLIFAVVLYSFMVVV